MASTDSLIERALSKGPLHWSDIVDGILAAGVSNENAQKEKMLGLLGKDRLVFFGKGCLWSALNRSIEILEGQEKFPTFKPGEKHQALIVSTEKTLDRVGVRVKYDTGECFLPEIKAFLSKSSYIRFIVDQRPNSREVARGIIMARQRKADMLIAIGGGSAIDMAKSISVGLRDKKIKEALKQLDRKISEEQVINMIVKRFSEYLTGSGEKVGFTDIHMQLPVIAVPTTAGTGSEATVCAVIDDIVTGDKLFYNGIDIVPHVAIIDPLITRSLPEHLTRFTGADAFVQTIEAYISREKKDDSDVLGSTPEIRAMAAYGMRLVADYLPLALDQPNNLNARTALALGAYLSGFAFSNSHLGPAHDIGHALETYYQKTLWHGEAVSRLLPAVLDEHIAVANSASADNPYCDDIQSIQNRISEVGKIITGKKVSNSNQTVATIIKFFDHCKIPVGLKDLRPIDPNKLGDVLQDARFPGFSDLKHPNLYDNPWLTFSNYQSIITRAQT